MKKRKKKAKQGRDGWPGVDVVLVDEMAQTLGRPPMEPWQREVAARALERPISAMLAGSDRHISSSFVDAVYADTVLDSLIAEAAGPELCRICNEPVRVMVMKNTGYCSQIHALMDGHYARDPQVP